MSALTIKNEASMRHLFAVLVLAASASLAGCSDDAAVSKDSGNADAVVDVGVDRGLDSTPSDKGCSTAADLQPNVPCAPNAGAVCPAGHACYGGRECRPVPCTTAGFCSGLLPDKAVAAQTYVPTILEGAVTIASDAKSFTITDTSSSSMVVNVKASGLTLPFATGDQLKAELCLIDPSPTSIGYVLVIRDAADALLLVSGTGNDASTASCLPSEFGVRRRETGCRPFPAPPPDAAGHWARFAFEIGGAVVEPGQGAKSFSSGGVSYEARVFDAYWFVEWQSPGTMGAYESFVIIRK